MIFIKAQKKDELEYIKKDELGHNCYQMNLENETFIHFTTKEKAKKIIKNKKIKIELAEILEATFAISTTYGEYVPSVQIKENENQIAIKFKTNTMPKIGFVEEVSWGQDINIINAEIISKEEAIKILNNTPYDIDDQECVIYKK